jgi:spore maturation protein CgeB
MKFVIFGLTVSTTWGNGHATLWRGLISALVQQGHRVVFFEKDQPFYSPHRDLTELPPGAELILYSSWEEILPRVGRELAGAEVGLVTSYCPDGVAASRRVLESSVPVRCFYDMDTPITLERAQRREPVEYIPSEGLGFFDIVLSYTGGHALRGLCTLLGARCVAPLYGSVDPGVHYPVPPSRPTTGTSRTWARTPRTGRPRWSGSSSNPLGGCPSGASSSAERSTRPTSPGHPTCSSSGTCPPWSTPPSIARPGSR